MHLELGVTHQSHFSCNVVFLMNLFICMINPQKAFKAIPSRFHLRGVDCVVFLVRAEFLSLDSLIFCVNIRYGSSQDYQLALE